MRRLRESIYVLLVGIIVAFIVGELCIRCIPYVKVSTVMWVPDKTMGALLKPQQWARFSHKDYYNTVVTNSHGHHDYEHTYTKPPDTDRILVIGDSFVEGLHVCRENLFFTLLARHLNDAEARNRTYEVIALARSGWGTAQELHYFKECGLNYKPDVVLLCFIPQNDFYNSYKPLMRDIYRPYYTFDAGGNLIVEPAQEDVSKALLLYRISKQSHLICFLKQNLMPLWTRNKKNHNAIPEQFGIYAEDKNVMWQEAMKVTLRCVREFDTLCKARNIAFLCAGFPTKYLAENMDIEEYYTLYPAMRNYEYDFYYPYRMLEEYCAESGIAYVAMIDYFQHDFMQTNKSAFFSHDGHLNDYGHQLVSRFFFDYLKSHFAEFK